MAEKPSMVDKVPTQLDEEELKAEMNVEIPQGMDMNEIPDNIEIMEEDDGSVVIDFDPREDKSMDGDFYANLAEDMSDDELGRLSGELSGEFEENKNSRQEWEDAFANGLELLGLATKKDPNPLGVPAELLIHYLQSPLHSSKHKLSMSSFHRAVQLELLSWEQAHQTKKIKLNVLKNL